MTVIGNGLVGSQLGKRSNAAILSYARVDICNQLMIAQGLVSRDRLFGKGSQSCCYEGTLTPNEPRIEIAGHRQMDTDRTDIV